MSDVKAFSSPGRGWQHMGWWHMEQYKLEAQGVAAHSKGLAGWPEEHRLCSRWLRFQVSEPQGHLAQKTFLESGTREGGKNKEK